MRTTIAIVRRELGVYLTTIIAYCGFGLMSFMTGLLFVSQLSRFQQIADAAVARQDPSVLERMNVNDMILGPTQSSQLWLFLFFVPFITMRLIAEEKAQRTFELLMSSPVRSIEVVLGKFFAVGVLIGILALLPLIYPVILDAYGNGSRGGGAVEWAPVWSSTLSVFLLGLTYASIGLLCSSVADSQIVAALLTFAVLFGGYLLPVMAARVEGDWRYFLEYAAPVTHVGRGMEGRVHVKDLVYFATVILASLALTHRVVESHRWR